MRYILTLIAFMCVLQADAQEIKVKRSQVIIDGVPVLKYKKNRGLDVSFYSQRTNEELIYLTTKPFLHQPAAADEYIVVNFLGEGIKTETTYTDRINALTTHRIIERFVMWLWDNGVINSDGTLHPGNIRKFHAKYDDNISSRMLLLP